MTRLVVSRAAGACARAALVAALLALPALLLDGAGHGAGASPVAALAALLAAVFTLSEYASASPSFVEFRDARPFNRLRFAALAAAVALAAVMLREGEDRAALLMILRALGERAGAALDAPGSPLRLLDRALLAHLDPALALRARDAAAAALLVSTAMVAAFALTLRLRLWPRRGFNVWVNLPHFDPTAGGDVVERLQRDALFNLLLGIVLPFLLPLAVGLMPRPFGATMTGGPAALVWTVTAWAFIPGSLLMRGLALGRLARMIALQRARAAGGAALQAA